MKKYLPLVAVILLFSSCVAKKYLTQSQMETAALREDSTRMANKIEASENNIKDLNAKIESLNNQIKQLGQQTA